MRKVDIPRFRREVLAIIDANRNKITSLDAKEDCSIFTFCGKNYACEVTLDDKWIGYDLGIDISYGMVECDRSNDTDNYPIYGDKYEEVALQVYDDLVSTIKAILDGRIYYASNDKFSYTVKKNEDGTYTGSYYERKKLLFWDYLTGWPDREYKQSEIKKLKLKVLT